MNPEVEDRFIIDKLTANLWMEAFFGCNRIITDGKNLTDYEKDMICVMGDICRIYNLNPKIDGIDFDHVGVLDGLNNWEIIGKPIHPDRQRLEKIILRKQKADQNYILWIIGELI